MSQSPLSILSVTDFNKRPIEQTRLLSTFRSMIDEHGYVLMVNADDQFDHVRFCQNLGPFVPNYNGSVVGDVRPEPGMDDVYHAGNTRPLTPHTEGYDFEVEPPHYIALWCVQPVENGGGETTIADTRRWVSELSDAEREMLLDTTLDWKTTDGIKRLGLDLSTHHPLLEKKDDNLIVRFSCNNILIDDDHPIRDIQQRWHKLFDSEHVAVDYRKNDMLVWDNHRFLHARNAFKDYGRHLRRLQIN